MKTIYLLCIISSFINGVFGEVKPVSVMEGDSVTLYTDTKLQSNDLIAWTFKDVNDPIATLDRADNKISYGTDGRFKDRLKLSAHTGDLTITNITTQHSGDYQLDINRDIVITKKFNVIGVRYPESDQLKSVSVKDGDSVTLHTDVFYINKYDEILWRFQGIPIAKFNKSASEISEDERFRDKLQPDVQTGSLQIKNIRTDLSGLYEVDLTTTSSSYTIHQSFTVIVNGEVKPVSVWKGYPVTIYTDVPDIKTYDQILLIFGCDDRIAEVFKQNKQFTPDTRFRDRLKLNDQTGDLTITEIRTEDAGDYELKMISRRRTIQRRFSVSVSERDLSPGAIAGIIFSILLPAAAAAAAGVIYYRRKIAELMNQLDETLNVNEGKSVDLKTKVKDIKRDDVIEWRFEETLIAEINPANNSPITYDGDYDEFRDKLELNPQTGDLNISDIRQKHNGVYILKIIRDGETSYKNFIVFVRGERETLEVDEGKSVNLKTKIKDIKKDDVIEWRFRETLIAEINPANNIFTTYDDDYDLFRDKLKLNNQTGDLTIKDIIKEHDGVYTLKIIRDETTSYKTISVSVRCKTEFLKVNEEESVNLKTEVTDIQRDDVIEWRFGDKEALIAEINPVKNIFSPYNKGLFRDKLTLDHQTGDLNIKDIRWKHAGEYKLKIIKDGKTSYKTISVSVTCTMVEVYEGKSADLKTKVTDIQRDDVIEWRFKGTLIAKINPANNIFNTSNNDLFRDKLKLNDQTGDLKINDIRWEHTGFYTLKIIRGGETSDRRFAVYFRASKRGGSVETRGGDSVGIEMDPLLNNSRQ